MPGAVLKVSMDREGTSPVHDLPDDASSCHSAFDSPEDPPAGQAATRANQSRRPSSPLKRTKQKKKKQKKVRKKDKKDLRSLNAVNEPGSSCICDQFALPEELFDPLQTPADTSASASQTAPRPKRRSTACAKLLVRAGPRCRCHFIYVSRCPYTEFAPEPVD